MIASLSLMKGRTKSSETYDARTASAMEGRGYRETEHGRACRILRDAVLDGRFHPGEVVTLKSLARTFAIGEMPIRQALRRLTSEGAFEARPNRSACIPVLTRRDVEQILELRQLLEGKAAAMATRNMTLEHNEYLRALQRKIESSFERADMRAQTELGRVFHFAIYRIADNEALLALIRMLWLRMGPIEASSVPLMIEKSAAARRVGLGNHASLLAAFHARDPVAAELSMHRDLLGLTTFPGYWESLPCVDGTVGTMGGFGSIASEAMKRAKSVKRARVQKAPSAVDARAPTAPQSANKSGRRNKA